MSDNNKTIFFANWVYPDAEQIFLHKHKNIDEIKNDCFIVLDTNTLLVPYIVGKDSLEQIKTTYHKLIEQKRLIVPGQVAREFANNRANKVTELYQSLSRKKDGIKKLELGNYPILEQYGFYNECLDLEKKINEQIIFYQNKIGNILEYISGWNWNDPVSLIYKELFKDVIFEPKYTEEEAIKDFERRIKFKIPPGYKDASKSSGGIGDLLVWYAILEIGKNYKKSVIFVSGEEKPDWWHRGDKKALFPRYELIDEFRRFSEGQSFHIIEFSKLLKLYGASDKVVEEVRQKERKYSERVVSFTVGADFYIVNNEERPLYGLVPYIKNDRVYIPLSICASSLGIPKSNILINDDQQAIIIVSGDKVIKIIAGSKTMIKNGIDIAMDVSPDFIGNQVMMPVRFVAQALDAEATYDASTQTVTLFKSP